MKDIAITDALTVNKAKTKRKAQPDEVIEVLEGPRTDDTIGLTRLRARSLVDGVEGWISIAGNQGTPFLQEVEKPFLVCHHEVPLEKELKAERAEVVEMLQVDAVVEVLEGPRQLEYDRCLRLRAKAFSDGKVGWLTLKDKKGVEHAKPGTYYKCVSGVGMTDKQETKSSKVLRRVDVGELIAVLEGPIEDESATVSRIKGRSMKDKDEGWVTIQGNAGTTYFEESKDIYQVTVEVSLESRFVSEGSTPIRKLAEGEALEVFEGPKAEESQPDIRVKGRALSGGAVGWLTVAAQGVKAWSPFYRCLKATPIHDALVGSEAKVLRELRKGETVELMDGPKVEGSSKAMRMKGRVQGGDVTGWMTIRDADGTRFLQC